MQGVAGRDWLAYRIISVMATPRTLARGLDRWAAGRTYPMPAPAK